ncbi:MAG: flippase [Acidobacteriota bacterium]|nr:flippase [Acidobacteriota bacterium]
MLWRTGEVRGGAAWLLAHRAIEATFGLTVGVWLARYLGTGQYGVLQYAIAFVALFNPITNLGLNALLVRHLVQAPGRSREILGTAAVLRFIAALISFAAAITIIRQMQPGAPATIAFIAIISLGSVFEALHVTEYWLHAQSAFREAALARMIAVFIAAALRIAAIVTGQDLRVFVLVLAIEPFLIAASLTFVSTQAHRAQGRWRFSLAVARELLSESWLLILSGIGAMIYFKIDQVMIGEMLGPESVGIYAAAARISEAAYFIPALLATAAFPTLLRAREGDPREYRRLVQSGYDALAWLGFSIAVVLSLGSGPVVHALYGAPFAQSAGVLAIHSWAAIFIFMRALLSKWLIAEKLLLFSVVTHLAGALTNVVLNLLLIPAYGPRGAAWATVVSYALASYGALLFHPKTRDTAWMMTLALLAPVRLLLQRARRGAPD